ncbi:little elongation complex subunit 2-like isoform X2 [Eriocheir sinensis]|uniref:little elongation complex subunit 2-like isoform X2 n=1 Tax=Eriocheir sinensis TaxID=95602 RepID=UPI0021C71FCA|nr:little elongation complex subunit 2-like isoform X2 [Eriocheir sinensis]
MGDPAGGRVHEHSALDEEDVTFIPGLFKGSKGNDEVEADDLFINQAALQDYCSIFSPDGVPKNIRGDPYLSEIVKFSEECLNDIAQIQREQKEREDKSVEEKKKKGQEIATQKIKKTLDRQVDSVLHERSFYLKKQCPVKIPYKSSLTHEEHAAYLRAFIKFNMRPTRTAADTAEYENYLRLQHRVYEEQKNFMEFSYQVAELELQTYNTVPEVITSFIRNYVQHRSKRATKYEEQYVCEQQVPICPQDQEKHLTNLSFSHLGHVLSLGTLPQFVIPHKLKLHTLNVDDSISKKDHMAQNVLPDKNILINTPVSADRNAEYLARHHQANIVISTSAMKVLADNHGPNFYKEWDIPVEVKSYVEKDADGRETNHRVVYIDKPMPKKIWTPLEKKQLYFKKAALAKFTVIKKTGMFRMETPSIFKSSEADKCDTDGASRSVTKYDGPFMDLSYTADCDVFGDESIGSEDIKRKIKEKKKSPTKAAKSEMDSLNNSKDSDQDGEEFLNISVDEGKSIDAPQISGETVESEHKTSASELVGDLFNNKKVSVEPPPLDKAPVQNIQNDTNQKDSNVNSENFLDNLLTMQDSMLKPLQTQSETTRGNDGAITSASDRHPQKPWTHTLHTNWKKVFQPHICPEGTGKNAHYHLFSLGSNTCQSSGSFQSMRILVRSNLHGHSYFKNEENKCKPYIVYPKIESQAFFGCEVNTLSEITQQWVQLLVRPNTSLLQVRVCEGSGEVLMTEEKDLATILKEGKQLHVGFSPLQPLATLYSVFSAVLAQPTGHYLLHHDSNTNAFIQLMKASNPSREATLHTYNLHKVYAAPAVNTRMYAVAPWLAIDTHVLSPFHMKHKKIPGTFPMSNPNQKISMAKRKKIAEKSKKKKSLHDLKIQKEEELSLF